MAEDKSFLSFREGKIGVLPQNLKCHLFSFQMFKYYEHSKKKYKTEHKIFTFYFTLLLDVITLIFILNITIYSVCTYVCMYT